MRLGAGRRRGRVAAGRARAAGLCLAALASAGCAQAQAGAAAGADDAAAYTAAVTDTAAAGIDTAAAVTDTVRAGAPTYEIRGARWWNGEGFEPRTMHVAGGRFVQRPPGRADSVLDLSGAWVVPPYGEAHTHSPAYSRERVEAFERAGVFYAMIMNVHASTWAENASWFEGPVEATATVAAFTAPNGHPVQFGLRGGGRLEEFDGDWITAVASEADVEAKWAATAALNRDFIKTFLLYSDRYEERASDETIPPRYRGMDPALLPGLVRRAHAAGLRVATHVRTRHDFAVAAAAGTDILAHLPGFSMGPGSLEEFDDPDRRADLEDPDRFRLTPADVAAAVGAGVTVITTIGSLGQPLPEDIDPDARAYVEGLWRVRRDILAHNLRLLRDAGVTIAIGSDAGEGDPVEEALVVHELDVFDPAEILHMLAAESPRLIFPERRIGRLEEGFEASFLALEANPLEDMAALRRIRLRFKGAPLPN